MNPGPLSLSVQLTPEQVERIAERAAEILAARLEAPPAEPASPYLTVVEAAEYLRAKRHRIDDLLTQGRLTRIKDGTRTLILRAELDAYVRGDAARARRAGRRAA